MTNYENKYLKYKQKYLELKNQVGGNKLIATHIPELLTNPNITSTQLDRISGYLLVQSNIDIIKKYSDLIINSNGSLELIKLLCTEKSRVLIETYVPEILEGPYNLYLILSAPKILSNYKLISQIPNIRDSSVYQTYQVSSDKPLYNNKTFNFDMELKNKWISAQCTPEAKSLGKFILDITKHVSYQDFQDKLLESIKKIPTNKKYVIYISGEYGEKKSNEWILAMLIDKISKLNLDIKIFDIVYYRDINYFEKINLYSLFGKYLNFLLCDDGSYSGKQLSDSVKVELGSLYKSASVQCIYCLVPYVSTCAEARLRAVNVIPLYSDKIPTIKERCEELGIRKISLENNIILDPNVESDLIKLQILLNTYFPNLPSNSSYDLTCGTMPFYFDHKIADNVSTLPIIYHLGYIHPNQITNCNKNNSNILIFNNCDKFPTLKLLDSKEIEQQCIVPYYKQLNIEIKTI